jgi:hypothetical protein
MFCSSSHPASAWHRAVTRAVDLAIAFATLDSYGIDGARDAAGEPPKAPPLPAHPHRAPLTTPRPPRPPRRPGVTPARPGRCVTPLRHAPRGRPSPQRAAH